MTTTEEVQLNIETMASGAAIERINDEINSALKNCLDLNAKQGVRKVTLVLSFKPSEDRATVDIDIDCSSKIQPPFKVATRAYMGLDIYGRPEAFEIRKRQTEIPFATNQPKLVKGGV